jgi:hypothetical protein
VLLRHSNVVVEIVVVVVMVSAKLSALRSNHEANRDAQFLVYMYQVVGVECCYCYLREGEVRSKQRKQ